MKYFSMFSGIGGFELGIKRAMDDLLKTKKLQHEKASCESNRERRLDNKQTTRLGCVGYSEIDKYAIQIYEKHFGGIKNYGDAKTIKPEELPNFDMLCGGFPCQAFSVAGKRRGFEDTRGTLFFDIARILKVKRPKIVFLENVKGLLNHEKGKTFAVILQTLAELGYNVQWMVLNSKFFGVPQNRERVFIIGSLRGTSRPKILPFRLHAGQVSEIPESRREVSYALDSNYYKGTDPESFYKKKRRQLIYTNERRDWRKHVGDSPTLKQRMATGGNNVPMIYTKYLRKLTPVECERLQGFPDGWTEGLSDTQRYKCLGNAVTVNVIKEVFGGVLKCLS